MAWEIESIESMTVVFVCTKCCKVSTDINKCNHCKSKDLVECTLLEQTSKYYKIDVDSKELMIALASKHAFMLTEPSNHRTYIVTLFNTVQDMISTISVL